jgi:ankyrin repeat protein
MHHYPLEEWSLSLDARPYMLYEIDPGHDLADLSESEVYKQVAQLAAKRQLVQGLGVPGDDMFTRLALAKNSHQRTPLHHAAASGNVGSIKALLEAGADPNRVDVNGSNPLHTVWFSSLDIAQISSEYCPEKLRDPIVKVVLNRSVLISQMEHLRPWEVVDLLLKAGADPHSRNLENSDAKSSAFLNLLIMLRLSPGDLFSSHSVAWSQTPFSPWYSSFPYRKPWISPLSW